MKLTNFPDFPRRTKFEPYIKFLMDEFRLNRKNAFKFMLDKITFDAHIYSTRGYMAIAKGRIPKDLAERYGFKYKDVGEWHHGWITGQIVEPPKLNFVTTEYADYIEEFVKEYKRLEEIEYQKQRDNNKQRWLKRKFDNYMKHDSFITKREFERVFGKHALQNVESGKISIRIKPNKYNTMYSGKDMVNLIRNGHYTLNEAYNIYDKMFPKLS